MERLDGRCRRQGPFTFVAVKKTVTEARDASQVDRAKRLKNKLFLEVSGYVTRHIF